MIQKLFIGLGFKSSAILFSPALTALPVIPKTICLVHCSQNPYRNLCISENASIVQI